MPKFARRLAWLEKVFPPAGGQQPQPTEYSQDIVLTHPSVPASANFADITNNMIYGISGYTAASGYVPSGKFWWVQACSMSHNTAAGPQHCWIEFVSRKGNGAGGAFEEVVVAREQALATSSTLGEHALVCGFRFCVPPGGQITAHQNGIQAGYGPTLRWSFLELDMGSVIW